MQQIKPDLWATEIENPAAGLYTHAYLLTRDDGNLLFYNTGHRHEIERMSEPGGVARQYLSHQDELGDTLKLIGERFGARLGGHVEEEAVFARYRQPDVLFSRRETHLGNIDVIPTPGHTPGSTCFLVDSPQGGRYLFTGDTIVLNAEGAWEAGYIHSFSDRDALAESLKLLRDIEPNLVLSSACGGNAGFEELPSPASWRERVDGALEHLLR